MIYFKEKLRFLNSFTSFYLSSATISVFILVYLAIILLEYFLEGHNLIFIFCLYLVQLILASFFYANRLKDLIQEYIVSVALIIFSLVLMRKLFFCLFMGDGFVLTSLYKNISLICLFPVGITYLASNDFNNKAIQRVLLYSLFIYLPESIISCMNYYIRLQSSEQFFTEQGFHNHIWEHIISYFSYLMAIIVYCKIYPLMHPFFVKLNNRFSNIYLLIRSVTFLIGIPTLLLLVIFG